jgi:DNA-binding NarL/FixJ family response regulator
MKKVKKICIIEDHPLFTRGIAHALEGNDEFVIAGHIDSAATIIDKLNLLNPDILLLDVNLSGINSLDLLPAIKLQFKSIKVLVLTMYFPEDLHLESVKEFIDGYVLKNSGTEILMNALHELVNNKVYWDPNIKAKSLEITDASVDKYNLSSREKEILIHLKKGLNNKEIGKLLFISALTVKTHRKNIMSKLNASNFGEMIQKTWLFKR